VTVVAPPITDALSVLRGELADLVATLGVPFHVTEPRTAGQVPLIYLAPPSITFVDFDKLVEITWPLVLVQHSIDTEASQLDADALVWAAWLALGGGTMRRLADNLRTMQVTFARAAGTTSLGDVSFPAYEFDVRFTIHASLCDP
jgi:hypothetical protein